MTTISAHSSIKRTVAARVQHYSNPTLDRNLPPHCPQSLIPGDGGGVAVAPTRLEELDLMLTGGARPDVGSLYRSLDSLGHRPDSPGRRTDSPARPHGIHDPDKPATR
jgi:hypothetical protein